MDDNQPSELGEDVCLEYTDFGQDLGFPVTWSESDYDEDHQAEEPVDEFAEFLLMDSSEGGDHSFGFERFNSFRTPSKYSTPRVKATINRRGLNGHHPGMNEQAEEDEDDEDDEDEDDDYLGLMLIEDLDPCQLFIQPDQPPYSNPIKSNDQEPDQQQSTSGDDGATTDSLDEDDHSGLVRFGIEADDSHEIITEDDEDDDDHHHHQELLNPSDEHPTPDSFNLPITSPPLGSILTNLHLFASKQTNDSTDPIDPCMIGSTNRSIKPPIMGTFSVDRQDGSNAGRTIIDDQKSLPLSPFTGGKVIRYNRFKKLRQQSSIESSNPSSIGGTPMAEDSQELLLMNNASRPMVTEDEFDITAFIRGISSIDESCSDGEKKDSNEGSSKTTMAELDGLSRWQRVPMSAFRRRMMMRSDGEGHQDDKVLLDGAILQPSSSLGQTLSLCQPGRKRNKRQGSSNLQLSILGSPTFFDRRDQRRRLKKTTSYNSNGKQSKLDDDHLLDCHQLVMDPSSISSGLASSINPARTDHRHPTIDSAVGGDVIVGEAGLMAATEGFNTRLFDEVLMGIEQPEIGLGHDLA